MANLMRAVRISKFGGPKVLQIKDDVPIPSIGAKQVLVKVKSAGINPVDTYIREGAMVSLLPDLPFTPGKDAAGVVETIGENVTKLKIGDRVFVCGFDLGQNGTYAEYVAINEDEAHLLPDEISFHQGACIGIPYFTAYRALILKGKAAKGSTVLIHGASGAVGLAAAQMCKAYGMITLGTAGTQEGMKLVKDNGADHVFCHREKDYLEKIMETTHNKGIDVILEMLSNVNLGKDLSLLARGGRVMIIGCRGDVVISPREMMFPETSIIGVALLVATKEEMEETFAATNSGLKEGWIKPVVSQIYPLKDVASAHHDIIHTKGAKGNIVLSLE